MASKGRTGKIETLIESCRSEGKWAKSIELAEELKNSSPNHGKKNQVNFLILIISIFLLPPIRMSIQIPDWRR